LILPGGESMGRNGSNAGAIVDFKGKWRGLITGKAIFIRNGFSRMRL